MNGTFTVSKQNNETQICHSRAEVLRSFITTTVRDESQVTPQGLHL